MNPGTFVDLLVVAHQLGQPRHILLALARQGRFPPVIRITERRAVVRAADVERWLRESTVSPETEQARRAIAEELAAGPTMPRSRTRRIARKG